MTRLHGLTSLRAVAALWVALGHYFYQVPIGTGWWESILRVGGLGVPLFFVLSGFILSHTYQDRFSGGISRQIALDYARARFARVYPVHIVILIVMALVLVPLGIWPLQYYDTATSWFASAALVHAWGMYPVPIWNQPSWTISVEFICYALFPLIAAHMARLGRRSAWVWGACLAVTVIGATLVLQPEWVFYFPLFIVKYTAFFVGGCLLYQAFRNREADLSPATTATVIAISLLGIGLAALLGSRLEGAVPVLFAAWIYALSAGKGPARRLFEHKWFVYAGEISYSYFLAHEAALLILLWLGAKWGLTPQDISLWLKAIFALAFAIPLYHWVEVPARRAIRSAGTTHQKATIPAS